MRISFVIITAVLISSLVQPIRIENQVDVEADSEAEIIDLIVKPVIGMLENLLLGKPILMCKGKGCKKTDSITAKHPDSAAKVTFKSTKMFGKKPKIYQYAQLGKDDLVAAQSYAERMGLQYDSATRQWKKVKKPQNKLVKKK